MSYVTVPGSSGGGGGDITSILTDSGTATPIAGVIDIITGVSSRTCGSTVEFTGGINIVQLHVTDPSNNTIIGYLAGPTVVDSSDNVGLGSLVLSNMNDIAATFNVGIGSSAANAITTGSNNTAVGGEALTTCDVGTNNTAIGFDALLSLESGSNNTAIGYLAGYLYGSTESNNIVIGHPGVSGTDSGVIRIGTPGTQTKCFVAGIAGAAVSGAALVSINPATSQLGALTTATSSSVIGTAPHTTLSSTSNILYQGPYLQTGSATETNVQFVMPCNAILSDLYVNAAINVSTTNCTVKLRVNGSDTVLVATVTALTTGNFVDNVHSVSVNGGDLIDWAVQQSTTSFVLGTISMKIQA